ncbi:hypothetical protein [uncultured Helicobacter sp.]|uniref:hypothetical protein n=1 Tax=uncultured Helicobacter sp. TaxID=175537 RepID=UPI00374EEEFA
MPLILESSYGIALFASLPHLISKRSFFSNPKMQETSPSVRFQRQIQNLRKV